MQSGDALLDHLFRRAGFGASAADLQAVAGMSYAAAVDYFVDYDKQPDDVDSKIGLPDYVSVTTRGQFSPNTNIDDARQRWLFRMVHTRRPLQEKMALFWHNHFGVGYSKVAGVVGAVLGTKMMANKAGETPGPQGHYELVRQMAVGRFRDLLIAVAQDPAMLVFLDGRTNTRARPQENFGREVMELFTWGIGHYTEADVYAAARVFTGWNLRNVPGMVANDPAAYQEFQYNAAQHETTAKAFTFPLNGGSNTIPARAAASGMQDGIDFLTSLANHPETARRLAQKLWNFFVSDLDAPDRAFGIAVAIQAHHESARRFAAGAKTIAVLHPRQNKIIPVIAVRAGGQNIFRHIDKVPVHNVEMIVGSLHNPMGAMFARTALPFSEQLVFVVAVVLIRIGQTIEVISVRTGTGDVEAAGNHQQTHGTFYRQVDRLHRGNFAIFSNGDAEHGFAILG